MPQKTERSIQAIGRRGSFAGIVIGEYKTGVVVASAEDDKFTSTQFKKALRQEYPSHSFHIWRDRGYVYGSADPVSNAAANA